MQTEEGLRLVTFELGGADALAALDERLERAPGAPVPAKRAPGRVTVSGPDGQRLAFSARA